LFSLGLICLTWGLFSFYVEQTMGILTMVLVFLGSLSFLICFIKKKRIIQKYSNKSQWKQTGIFSLLVLLSLIFFVGINTFAYSLPWRWDVTQNKQHTLTESTIEFIQGLESEIQLTALTVGTSDKYLEDLFKEYARISKGKIKTEIIDPIVQIGYAAQFGSVISGKERKVIVRSGNERRNVDFTNASLKEEQLTNAIVRVTREERHVYFLTGHGEYAWTSEEDQGLSLFATLLDSNNIISKTLHLGNQEKIPEDCDVLIIAGAHDDLTKKEEVLIEEYLIQGGDVLFLIEHIIVTPPDQVLTEEEKDKNPSLNSILNRWGIHVEDDIVVDLSSHAGSDVGSPATRNYVPHKAITAGLDYTFYIRPRSINFLDERRSSIKLAPIVLTETKEKSWAETNRNLKIFFDESVDTPGPVPISFVIWEEKEEGDRSDTRIIVFTDADFLTNIYIDQYSNAEMGLNIINWLSEVDYKVFLDQKEIKVERLDLTSKQKRKIAALLFLMPFFIAVGGIVLWMKN